MPKGNELAKASAVTDAALEAKGVDPSSEDAIAIRSAVDGGMDLDDAVGALSVASQPSDIAYPQAQHSKRVASHPAQSSVEQDAEAQGYMVGAEMQSAQRRGFARGLGKAITEGQETNRKFFQEGVELAAKAFTFGG